MKTVGVRGRCHQLASLPAARAALPELELLSFHARIRKAPVRRGVRVVPGGIPAP